MHAVVIEHVRVGDLPETWRQKWAASPDAQVTIRIEEEPTTQDPADPLFGMWSDRADLLDVEQHVRDLRAPRFKRES